MWPLGGKQVRYTEFMGEKHDAWNQLNDHEIISWMLTERKVKMEANLIMNNGLTERRSFIGTHVLIE